MIADRITLSEIPSVPSRAPDERPHSWRPRSLATLGLEAPQPPSIGGELIYPGGRHTASGEPESLKTWYGLAAATEQIMAGNSVIWLDFEMGPAPMYERLGALGLTDDQITDSFLYLEPGEALTPALRPEFETLLAVHKPSLAVIDSSTPALELHGFDPNRSQDIEAFQRALIAPLRRCGAAVLQVDHLVKAKDSRGRFAIGSERKLGVADVHLSFQTVMPFGRGKTGKAAITVHKDRHGHLPHGKCAELELASDADTGRITWKTRFTESPADPFSGFRPTCLMQRVSIYLENCIAPVSRNTVLSDVNGKDAAVRQAIDRLVEEGFVETEPGPRNAQLLRSARSFREGQ